jgi:hypothetical protein
MNTPATKRKRFSVGDAQLVAGLLVAVHALDVLRGIDQRARRAGEGVRIEVGAGVGAVGRQRVVPEGVVVVVLFHVDVAVQAGERVGQVEVADPAFHRQRGLPPAVVRGLRIEVGQRQLAHLRVHGKATLGLLLLAHEGRGDRPVVVQVHLQRQARAGGVDLVVVLPGAAGVVDGAVAAGVGVPRRERARAVHVVDVAGVVLVPGDQADGRALAHGQVEEAFGDVADAAVADAVELQPVAGGEAGGVGLVGDDAQRAGLRTGAV